MKYTTSALAMMATMAFAGAASADCGEVSITEMDWASAAVVTQVATFLMTNGYGCTVQVIPSSTTPAMTSIAETGEPDILTELWTNTSVVYEELVRDKKLLELNYVLSDGGVEAWWIPDYLAEAHPELTTIEGILANPELVGGKFHDCPSGWACDTVNRNNLIAIDAEGNGLERFQHGSGETLAASIAAAYESQEPWFGYYWAPTSVLGKYPMVQVEVAEYDLDRHTCNTDANCENPKASAYPTSRVVTAVAPDLPEREPEVVEFLTKMSFTNADMGAVLSWQDENNASMEEAAVYFLQTYTEVWSEWLSDEARGKLSALLQ